MSSSAEVWSTRAEAFRESAHHRAGADLDRVVEWCEPGPGVTALDVATGGGHVARRLREAGCEVVTCDAAPGMGPDVVCRAEEIPFADSSFDVVVCRIAAHHFDDVRAAVREMARVARARVVVQDKLYLDEAAEEADRLRDPTHVRNYGEDEWLSFLAGAGLEVVDVERHEKAHAFDHWISSVATPAEEVPRIRELLAGRLVDGAVRGTHVLLKARKR